MKQTFIRTLIQASRTKNRSVIKEITFSATRVLMIALTKDVYGNFEINAL